MLTKALVLAVALSFAPALTVPAKTEPVRPQAPAVKEAKIPKALKKAGLSLGMTFEKLSGKRRNLKLDETESFRKVYVEDGFSEEIENLVYYVTEDKDGIERVYEFIIALKTADLPMKLGTKTWGKTNHARQGVGEWRFPVAETGLTGEMAAWIFRNKLVIAYAMPGSEWEPGFDQ